MENKTSIKVTEKNKEFMRRVNAANTLAHRGSVDLTQSVILNKLQQYFQKYPERWEELAKMEVEKDGFK